MSTATVPPMVAGMVVIEYLLQGMRRKWQKMGMLVGEKANYTPFIKH